MKTDASQCRSNRLTAIIVWTLRILIGATFIFSGFVKTIDLWGFIFKLEEYISVAGLSLPRSVTFVIALGVSAYEFVGGILLLSGSYKRSVAWLLTLMMGVMLPLTLYLWIADPIDDCGCFGDAWKLSNAATFFKNVLLTAGLIYLIFKNHRVKSCIFHPAAQWLEVVVSVIYIVMLGLICYNIQPMIDFRPYPEGRSITDSTDNDDEDNIIFRYTNGTETRDFSIDNLPTDTIWQYVDRIEHTSSEDNGSTMFTVYDGDEDVTSEVISGDGKQFLMVIPEMDRADISYTYFINELNRLASLHDIDFIGLLATDSDGIESWRDISMADYECFTVEDTSLKELVRGKMALVYLEDGEIKWKRTISSFDTDSLITAEQEYGSDFPLHIVSDLHSVLIDMTTFFIAAMLLLWVIQFTIGIISSRRNKKTEKQTTVNEHIS